MSPSPRGFILIEASIVYLVLSLALISLLPLFILCMRSSRRTADIALATRLSSELLEEVRIRRWDEKTPRPSSIIEDMSALPGVDSGENALDKRTFDDIDDFEGWKESPPLGPAMEPYTVFSPYSRSVAVAYVSERNPDAGVDFPTNLKKVTVCTSARKLTPVCLETLLANR